MKKIAISLLVCTTLVLAGGFVQTGVAPGYIVGSDTLFGGLPYDAGRGITSGSDLDQDGKLEVFITSYADGGRIFGFEEAGTDTFAYVWASPKLLNSDGSSQSFPRDVHTGDMDGDGNGEIIFHIGRYPTNYPDNGIYVFEWDGTNDDGYGTTAGLFANMYSAFNDSLNESRVEGFSVGDIEQAPREFNEERRRIRAYDMAKFPEQPEDIDVEWRVVATWNSIIKPRYPTIGSNVKPKSKKIQVHSMSMYEVAQ